MVKRSTLTKTLALSGTALVWLPLIAPVLFSLLRLVRGAPFKIDYLMPAEGFPLVLAGSGLLIWASVRAGWQVKRMAWLLGIAVLLLVGGQVFAVVTGLASGVTAPTGWQWAVVMAAIAGYTLAVIGIGILAIRLLQDLSRRDDLGADKRTR